MGHFSSMFNSLARSFSNKKANNKNGKSYAKEAADEMAREAKKKAMILNSSGCVNADGSNNLASVFSRRGEKGVNQDCAIVWEGFGCQEDMMFCGIFDGHGPWGHFVSKQVRNSMPISLLCNWQETLSQTTLAEPETDRRFAIWKHLYLKTCADVDQELQHHRKIDTFNSGTTALTVVRQGEVIYVANVGDSRAVLGTVSEEGSLTAVQLTVDFKPNIPQEEERIIRCNGRVFCLEDEPGVHRVWQPEQESPGLAMSRAFGDYCIKEYGLVSVPEVTQRHISTRDQFVILATDGVWDVISNEEAIDIVSSTAERPKAAKRLVEQAVKAWTGIRNDFAEIGGRFRTGISKLSENLASNFLQLGSEGVDPKGYDDVIGVTDEVVAFVRDLAMNPDTWLDLPLPDDDDDTFDEFEMSDDQHEHAVAVERLVPSLASLRIELCPEYMSENCFWMIYFVLLHPKLTQHDALLLSTPQVLEARAMLSHELQKSTRAPVEAAESSGANAAVVEPLTVPYNPSQESLVAKTVNPQESETDKHPIESKEEIQVVDKSVIEERNSSTDSSSSSRFVNVQAEDVEEEEEDADDWLNDEESSDAVSGMEGGVTTKHPIGEDEEDVSFSDLEDDEDEERDVPVSSKRSTNSSSPDWVQI